MMNLQTDNPQADQIPVSEILPLITAIANRDYPQFQQLEVDFAAKYGVEICFGCL